jgi:hypothetical protein
MIDPKIWGFPAFPISKQLFHVPGLAYEGGFTAGGARIMSPDVGGFAMLEIQPSMQTREWEYPFSSWLMSKCNGQILRVRMAPTPQVLSKRSLQSAYWDGDDDPELPWSNEEPWEGDLAAVYSVVSLKGSLQVTVDMSVIGEFLRVGHVIGHKNACYMVDEIDYDEDSVATIRVTPPLRDAVAINDPVYFRPWFTGVIANASEIRATYDAENVGYIQLGKIVLSEAVL